MKISKDYYTLLLNKKAQLYNNALVLKHDVNLAKNQLEKVLLEIIHYLRSNTYIKKKRLHCIYYTKETVSWFQLD